MFQYRITLWLDEETKTWNNLSVDTETMDVIRQHALTEREAEDIVKKMVRNLGLDGAGELSWDVSEIKEVMSGTVKY